MAQNRCHDSNAAATAAADPFANDPFWDSWDQPKATFDSDSDAEEPLWQEEFHGCDWGSSVSRRRAEAEVKRQQEDQLRQADDALAAFRARQLKKKAVAEAAEVAMALAEAKKAADVKGRWDREVERANTALALAKPAIALDILYSLFADESFDGIIDFEEQANIAQMAAALEIHHELQKSLSLV